MRIGIGFDTHRLIPTIRKEAIALGGVKIPCFYQIESHSDGDVVLHALTDAVLGALALGDIGQWFPDSDPGNAGRSSGDFLSFALAEAKRLGWAVGNIDCTVHLEEPKLASHSDAIRTSIAQLAGVELQCVSLKAKTAEGLGPVGERKAIEADAAVVMIPLR
ncbi:MAG: 2-C-methyl-D-erythritol 2,4-cyclodiphosphate synthase [Deltaproteobacteria bacterium]|nr:2-C-methyl-D-erythritol 2,4-cyclodiphosphate synthase [Deltaproteobacteria bacterium]